MTAMNVLIVLWLLAATAASFSVHPHRVLLVYDTNDFKARLRLARSVYPGRTSVTQLTSSGGDESSGPDDKDSSIAKNNADDDVIKNHHDSHHAALHHLKELTFSKIGAVESSVTRERENFQREISAVRTEGENRIVASENAYRDVNQANEGKSQARYDSIIAAINALGDKLDATNQKMDKQSDSIDELKTFKIQAALLWAVALVVLGAVGTVFVQFFLKRSGLA
jgi:hypothetical protein